jgi:hypothetical protein
VHASGSMLFQVVSAANENEESLSPQRGSVYAKRFGFNIRAVRT